MLILRKYENVITNVIIKSYIIKITTVGSSAGVVLPKDVLSRMKAKKGDTLFLIETKDGYTLTTYDPD